MGNEDTLTIDELLPLATAVAHTMNVIASIFDDGTVSISDIARVPAALRAAHELTALDWHKALPEFADMTTDEATKVAATFTNVFDIQNDTVEAVVENGLDLVFQGVQAVKYIRQFIANKG